MGHPTRVAAGSGVSLVCVRNELANSSQYRARKARPQRVVILPSHEVCCLSRAAGTASLVMPSKRSGRLGSEP